MTESDEPALGAFDARHTYGGAVQAYEDAARDFWHYVSMRSVERVGLRTGERVLDVPCGTGASLIAAAHAVGPRGQVTGIDYAPEMVAVAQGRVVASGLDMIEVRSGDMLAIDPPAVAFDAVVCALGVFFAPDMAALVGSLLALVQPASGRLVVGVFGEEFFEPMRSVFVEAVSEVAPGVAVVEPWRRTEQKTTLRRLFEHPDAGAVTIVTDHDRFPLKDPSDWWRVASGSALRHTLESLGPDAAAEVRARCEAHIATHRVSELTTSTRYVVATRR